MASYNTICVVCGRYSTRSSWNNTITVSGNTYVACDFHSLPEIQIAALAANTGSVVPEPSLVGSNIPLTESVEE
jgi:hypothetical protein